jgi:hypothetical protein
MKLSEQIVAALLEEIDPEELEWIASAGLRHRKGSVNLGGRVIDTVVAGGETGVPTGGTRRCACGSGLRIAVSWPDGKMTWMCSKTMRFDGTTAYVE